MRIRASFRWVIFGGFVHSVDWAIRGRSAALTVLYSPMIPGEVLRRKNDRDSGHFSPYYPAFSRYYPEIGCREGESGAGAGPDGRRSLWVIQGWEFTHPLRGSHGRLVGASLGEEVGIKRIENLLFSHLNL